MQRVTTAIELVLLGIVLFLLSGCAADYPGPYRYQSSPLDSYYYWYGYPPPYYGSPYGAGYWGYNGWPYWEYPDRYYRYPRRPHRHDDDDRKIIRPQPQPQPRSLPPPRTRISPKSPPNRDAPVRKAPEIRPIFKPEPGPTPPEDENPPKVMPRSVSPPGISPPREPEPPALRDIWQRRP